MKGITPVIAIILLLLVTISIVGFSFTFLSGTVETLGEGGQQALEHTVSQMGQNFKIEGTDENTVYVRNLGTSELSSLTFFVDNTYVDSTGSPIPPNSVGAFVLNDSKLAMLPGKELKVSSSGRTIEEEVNFYEEETVAYWKFDEGSGTSASDSSGNNHGTIELGSETMNDGTINGATWTAGKYGSALEFDGIDDYVDAGSDASLGVGENVTFEFWINRNGAGTTGSVDTIIANSQNYWIYIRRSDNLIVFESAGSGGLWGPDATSSISINDNEWYHIAIVRINSTNVKFYINGIFDREDDTYASDFAANTFYLGSWAGSNHNFNGIIDEVRIYDTALQESEIKEDMNSAYPIKRAVASYSFNEGSGSAKDTHNWIKGIDGSALSFNSNGEYVDLPTANPLDISSDESFTISLWANPQKTSSGYASNFISFRPSNLRGVGLEINSAGIVYFMMRDDSGLSQVITSQDLSDSWNHFVATFDQPTNTMKLYVNSVLVGSTNGHTTLTPVSNRIGGNAIIGGNAEDYSGFIDEVRILNIARSM